MIITVLWEDARGVVSSGFGPHELLVSCVADEIGCPRAVPGRIIRSVPKKGNGNVLRTLLRDLDGRLARHGPVLAVFDQDRVRELWPEGARPTNCYTAIHAAFEEKAPGSYLLLLIERNTETLIEAACRVLRIPVPSSKPSPDQRDLPLIRIAREADRSRRDDLRGMVPSYDRIVRRVFEAVKKHPPVQCRASTI